MSFDPYHAWLGIPVDEQPGDFYRLLGLRRFEDNPEVIDNAADRQMAFVRTFQAGKHADACERLLNELSTARVVLLDPQKRLAYNASLQPVRDSSDTTSEAPPVTMASSLDGEMHSPAPRLDPHPLDPLLTATQSTRPAKLTGSPHHNRKTWTVAAFVSIGAVIALAAIALLLFSMVWKDATTASSNPSQSPEREDPQAAEVVEQDRAKSEQLSTIDQGQSPSESQNTEGPAPSTISNKADPAAIPEVPAVQEIAKFQGHTSAVRRVDLSRDGSLAASASNDKTVRVWNTLGAPIAVLKGHTAGVSDVRISSDGGKLVSVSKKDKTLRIWNLDTAKQVHQFRVRDDGFGQCDASDDGRLIITGGLYFVRVFDAREQRQIHAQKTSGYAIAMSPDGATAAFGGWHKIVHLNDAKSWKRLRDFRGHTGHIYAMAFSPDHRFLGSGGPDRVVRIWDTATGKPIAQLRGHKTTLHSVALSSSAKFAVTVGQAATIIWHVPSGEKIWKFKTEAVRADISPDGKTLLTGHSDGSVRLWRINWDR